jgi:hypothetical protein
LLGILLLLGTLVLFRILLLLGTLPLFEILLLLPFLTFFGIRILLQQNFQPPSLYPWKGPSLLAPWGDTFSYAPKILKQNPYLRVPEN